jgi:hypothetical protein
MKLLTNKTLKTTGGSWFAPRNKFWDKYKSVVEMTFMDMTSSAGDWHGFLLQKVGKHKIVAIGFSQYNNYPDGGFTLQTCERPFYRVENTMNERNYMENIKNSWLQFEQ